MHLWYVKLCYNTRVHSRSGDSLGELSEIGDFIYPVVTGESKQLQAAAANFNGSLHQLTQLRCKQHASFACTMCMNGKLKGLELSFNFVGIS